MMALYGLFVIAIEWSVGKRGLGPSDERMAGHVARVDRLERDVEGIRAQLEASLSPAGRVDRLEHDVEGIRAQLEASSSPAVRRERLHQDLLPLIAAALPTPPPCGKGGESAACRSLCQVIEEFTTSMQNAGEALRTDGSTGLTVGSYLVGPGCGSYLVMQRDCNLVMYNVSLPAQRTAIWATSTKRAEAECTSSAGLWWARDPDGWAHDPLGLGRPRLVFKYCGSCPIESVIARVAPAEGTEVARGSLARLAPGDKPPFRLHRLEA
jgi:outer membrane murein-binding lipoprotein Lpp